MAQISDKSTFTFLASGLAIILIAAAGVVYLQSGDSASDDPGRAFVALSQAIPLHAASAVSGGANGFERLDADLERLATLRRGASSMSMPGDSGAWQRLEQRAQSILARRGDIEAIFASASSVDASMPTVLDGSNELLDRSGATAVLQEFQRRGARLQRALGGLASSADPGGDGARITDDVAYLRLVADALSGANTNLDVSALDDGTRETVLAPIVGELSNIEAAVGEAVSAAANIDGTTADLTALRDAAYALYGTTISSSASTLPGIVTHPLSPLALLGVALLMLIGLGVMHARTSVFERASREQTEQNERNQQAILRLLDELGSLADGDLTVEATVTEDITGAIADSINYAIEKLRELVATINDTAIMVASAAKQTEGTAAHMARAAETQTREIAAATESIVSMAGSIEEVSGNAERSSDVARHSVEVAHKGGEAVRRTIDGMNAIRETIQETSKRIKRLGESSQEIGNIIELINDIAEQTNILALNASIQASMAGEAGRGFAVVADEVQRLAERSTNATKQIEVLVRTIQADTNEAVVSMERSTTDVVGGALLAENAGAALDEIEQVSNQIANLVQNISGSARQQAGSAADVTRRTTKLKEISDQTGKATTATAASISKLSELASQLRQTVAGFTLPSSAMQTSALSGAAGNMPPVAPVVDHSPTEEKAAG